MLTGSALTGDTFQDQQVPTQAQVKALLRLSRDVNVGTVSKPKFDAGGPSWTIAFKTSSEVLGRTYSYKTTPSLSDVQRGLQNLTGWNSSVESSTVKSIKLNGACSTFTRQALCISFKFWTVSCDRVSLPQSRRHVC